MACIAAWFFLAFLFIAAEFARRRAPNPRRSAPPPLQQSDWVPAELYALIKQVDALWAEQGHARPTSRAPVEHLRLIPQDKLSPKIREASGKIIESFYRCCFAGWKILPAEIQGLRQEFERARTWQ